MKISSLTTKPGYYTFGSKRFVPKESGSLGIAAKTPPYIPFVTEIPREPSQNFPSNPYFHLIITSTYSN
jgi:hypothetical protein